jgi:surfactin synthase thioesterase subunit
MHTRLTGDRLLPWFIFPHPAEADAVLYCLPHSGGGATAYKHWLSAFPPRVTVCPLQLPGRESRAAEPVRIDIGEISDVVTSDPRPFALYGHSLGALAALEVTRELQRRGKRKPVRLFVGACGPPWQARVQASEMLELSDREFGEALNQIGGMPPELQEAPELLRYAIEMVRADFGWMARYPYSPESVLTVPVVALAGADDTLAPSAAMSAWSAVTSAGFALHTLPGGHFFARQRISLVARIITQEWLSSQQVRVLADHD